MIPWELLETARIPGDKGEIRLFRRDTEYSIRLADFELMNSRVYGSAKDLARLALEKIAGRPSPRILIGGLGMGFTVAAALGPTPADGRIEVAELVPAVIKWNRTLLAHVAGHPLDDPRVTVIEDDVARIIRKGRNAYDAILLDVDNGPEGITIKGNDWLYSPKGLAATGVALRPGGILAVWSASSDPRFTERLCQAGFKTEEARVRARRERGGIRHTVWLAWRRQGTE